MSKVIEELRKQIKQLETQLKRGEPHECRECLWHACDPDKCHCACGTVSKERQLHLERLRYLVECAETGEVPIEVSNKGVATQPVDPATQLGHSSDAQKHDDALDVLFDGKSPMA